MNQLSCRSPYSASHLPPAGHVTGHVTNNNTRHYTANSWSSASCTSLHSYWPIPYTTVHYFHCVRRIYATIRLWNSCGFNGLRWSHCCEVIQQKIVPVFQKRPFLHVSMSTLLNEGYTTWKGILIPRFFTPSGLPLHNDDDDDDSSSSSSSSNNNNNNNNKAFIIINEKALRGDANTARWLYSKAGPQTNTDRGDYNTLRSLARSVIIKMCFDLFVQPIIQNKTIQPIVTRTGICARLSCSRY